MGLTWFLTVTGIAAMALAVYLMRQVFIQSNTASISDDSDGRPIDRSVIHYDRHSGFISIIIIVFAVIVGVLA